jgi:SulP family sulfate permease
VGFVNAIGINIVLGQLGDLTGYDAAGGNRIVRAIDTVLHPGRIDPQTLAVGIATIVAIVVLERTRLRSLGLVVGLIATSAACQLLGWDGVATLRDLGVALDGLPRPVAPALDAIPALLLPALSLAFVGLVQGSSVSASFPEADGSLPDVSRDFAGQGAANVASSLLRGMPVGGSVSGSALLREAGGTTRRAAVVASVVMVIVVLAFGDAVGSLAMPALAGLLALVGYRTVKPAELLSTWRTGAVQRAVLGVTFVLTMIVPLQYAVLIGVGLAVILHVVRQSNQIVIRRRVRDDAGELVEVDPPLELPARQIVVLQPYGSLFFAAAPMFEAALPEVGPRSTGSVVIVRLRGRTDLGTTFMDVLRRYAASLDAVGSKLVIVSASERVVDQLAVTGVTAVVGAGNVYPSDERVGATLRRAEADAQAWIAARTG